MGVGMRVPGTLPRPVGGGGGGSMVPKAAGNGVPGAPVPSKAAGNGNGVTREGFDGAVEAVLLPGVRESARRYRDLLREEDGVGVACSAIASTVCLHAGN